MRVSFGIIPANTGKIASGKHTHKNARDHPREYGENGHGYYRARAGWGSSPRIRGK